MRLSQLVALAEDTDLLDAVHGQLLMMVCGNDMLANPGPQGVWALQLLQGKRKGDVRAVTARLVCTPTLWPELEMDGSLSDQSIRAHIDRACVGIIPDWALATDPGDGTELQ